MKSWNSSYLKSLAAIAARNDLRMEGEGDGAPAAGTPAGAQPDTTVIRDTGAPAKPEESAVEKASREARAKIASGVSLDPAAAPEPAPAKKTAGPAKPRDPTSGKFKPSGDPSGSVGDSTRNAAAADEDVDDEPVAGQDPAEGDPDAGKGEKPGQGKKPAEGAAAGEEGEGGEEGAGEGEGDGFEVELPNRRDGAPPLKLVVEDEETANTLRMLTNSFERRASLDQRQETVNRMATDYQELKEIMEFDPAGFAIDSFSQDPATAEVVALSLLADPKVWQRVAERVLQWEDPDKAETDRLRIRNQNLERKTELSEMITEQRTVQKNLREVQTAVASVIPPDMDEEAQAVFFRDALRDLKEYADRNNRMTLDIADIPLILASSGRLRAHGIDPKDAAERIVEARFNRQNGHSNGSQRPATSAPAPAKKTTAVVPQKTGKEMVQRSRAKRAAASSPSGAGSPSSAVTPPPNQSIAERIKWHKDRAQKGQALSRGA